MHLLLLSSFFSSGSFAASNCKPDVLIDDFATTQNATVIGENKIVNKLGGDYGSAGAPFQIDTSARRMRIIADEENIGQPEPWANPGTAPTFNYWFVKFDEFACYDLTPFQAIQFDLIAPRGSNMNFTLTQKSSDCQQNAAHQGNRLLGTFFILTL